MFENISKFFKKIVKAEQKENTSKDTAKERLHLVLMQDRANVSADFLELMKQEIIDVIKKYIVVDEGAIDVRLTNQANDDGTNGAPALYANIPIINIKNELKSEADKNIEENIEEDVESAETNSEVTEEVEEKEVKSEIKNDEKKEENKDKEKDKVLEQEKKDK